MANYAAQLTQYQVLEHRIEPTRSRGLVTSDAARAVSDWTGLIVNVVRVVVSTSVLRTKNTTIPFQDTPSHSISTATLLPTSHMDSERDWGWYRRDALSPY